MVRLCFRCFLVVLTCLMNGCIGIDYLDDPMVEQFISLPNDIVALKTGESFQITPEYYDQYGVARKVDFSYSSLHPTILEVSASGLVKAIGTGTGVITINYRNEASTSLRFNVVRDGTQVALVKITAEKSRLRPGEQTPLSLEASSIDGTPVSATEVEWFSENSSIAEVNSEGRVTAKAFGKVDIHAKVSGVKSNVIQFTVETDRVSGTFVPAGGYRAKGTAVLSRENGKLILRLENDFETSFALGTYVYLANSTNGQTVRTEGLEIAEIKTNGAHTFDLSSRFPQLSITDYSHVIILCKPASVTFGFAQLKN